MKKLFIVVCMFLSVNIYGQTTDTTVVDTVNYNELSKVQLTEIYLREVGRVSSFLPNSVFPSVEESVPKTKYTTSKILRTKKKFEDYNKTLLREYRDLIPYSDKQDLIDRIKYLRNL